MPEVDLSDLESPDPVTRLTRQRDALKRERDQALAAAEKMRARLDLLTALDATASTAPPRWMVPPARGRKHHHGIANLLLSDLHLDETVKPAQVSGVNAYDRRIALQRLERTAEQFVEVARDFINGISYDGACVWLDGDVFSGNIHEELKETNEAPIMASFDFWIDPVVAALRLVVEHFGQIHVVGRVGNHGRNSRKPVAKNRVEDNFDWLFYRVLQREFSSDSRVTWDLPLAADGVVTQYSTRFLATHGDQFRGGSGISGILTPLSLGDHRKSRRQAGIGEPYDYMVLGHFHQLMWLPRVIVNGSLKGYDEFAYLSNFGFEVPQQAFWITTPERGLTFPAAIQPMNRAKERW